MPGARAALAGCLCVIAVLLTGCSGDASNVDVAWQTEDGLPLSIDVGEDDNHATVVTIENDSGHTIRDAVLRFSPSTTRNAPIGFSVGTATVVRTEFENDVHVWKLGDIAPNTRMIFPLGLWFSVAGQLSSSPPVDLVVTLESESLNESVTGVLTVQFLQQGAALP